MSDVHTRGERRRITAFTGVYNADGGLVGEVRYVVGHLLGRTECALCDITHSPVRRKAAWDRMVARFPVPISVVHRNELDRQVAVVVSELTLPVMLARWDDGAVEVALDAGELATMAGSVDEIEHSLRSALDRPSA
ncbi:hypothetical protein [Microbacterium sp. NPDC056234]|uniref:hypothetical protein n=1 Tax=Microbacterium sp. NPDC056234 TaxID=3345757 RepID=UPI0035DB4D3E